MERFAVCLHARMGAEKHAKRSKGASCLKNTSAGEQKSQAEKRREGQNKAKALALINFSSVSLNHPAAAAAVTRYCSGDNMRKPRHAKKPTYIQPDRKCWGQRMLAIKRPHLQLAGA